jgi:putative methyltransferase (TIGR01177 family)
MKIALLLSKSDPSMSKAEAIESCKIYFKIASLKEIDNLLILEINLKKKDSKKTSETILLAKTWLNRLALTKDAYLLLEQNKTEENKPENVIVDFEAISALTNNIQNPTFKISIRNTGISEGNEKILEKTLISDFAKMLAKNEFYKTNMQNPDLEFTIINTSSTKETIKGIRIWTNTEPFEERKAHLRPILHPTAINPRLARAMINLAGAEREILDPFCGVGGILLEASTIGLNAKGIDISSAMIARAKLNLKNENDIDLHEMDSLKWTKPAECVVTDLPYGKSSKLASSISLLTNDFLKHYANLTTKIVLCIPHGSVEDIPAPWIKLYEFKIYIHKSLTRNIMVLENRNL